jgi:hypothetical protein
VYLDFGMMSEAPPSGEAKETGVPELRHSGLLLVSRAAARQHACFVAALALSRMQGRVLTRLLRPPAPAARYAIIAHVVHLVNRDYLAMCLDYYT